jgi:hypothetical protein
MEIWSLKTVASGSNAGREAQASNARRSRFLKFEACTHILVQARVAP